MLVLSRKLNESIRIGNDVQIRIVRVKGNVVRLGIEAPKSVRVIREELQRSGPVSRAAGDSQAEATGSACDSRLFVGKLAAGDDREQQLELREEPATESAAPLRPFLRKALQATG